MRIKEEQIDIWNEKSVTYKRYNKHYNDQEKCILDAFLELGVDFDANIVDIGCGTGVYSLHIAQMAKSVLCVDISSCMLEILKEDAKRHEIKIETFCGDFFEIDKKFDLAFLSLSPAVNDEESASVFLKLADKIAYINHIKPRYHSIITPILEDLGCKKNNFIFSDYLKDNNINYKSRKLSEKNFINQSVFSIFDSLLWHLKINKIKLDFDKILSLLSDDLKDDFIYFIEDSRHNSDFLKKKTKVVERKSIYEMVVIN